jgi:hypothetical protein
LLTLSKATESHPHIPHTFEYLLAILNLMCVKL